MRKEGDAVAVDFIELMRDHNKGNTAFDMSKGINKVIFAIRETGKRSGSVTLKLNFSTLDGDINKIYVTDEVSVKPPKENRRGSMFFSTCEYVNEHKNKNTRIFVSETESGATYTAFIDYHDTAGIAAWKKHRCILELRHSKDFAEFKQKSGVSFAQPLFAEFIEDHSHCFMEPTAAEMMEVAITLEAKKAANFRSAVRLSNGTVQLRFEETIAAKAGEKGQLEIPEVFSLDLIPFKGGANAIMHALLRYRLSNDGVLTLHYKIVNLQRTIDDAIESTTAKIRDDVGLPIFFGVS